MNITSYARRIIDPASGGNVPPPGGNTPHPSGHPSPQGSDKSPRWTADTEDVVALSAFLLGFVFLVFLGAGWLMERATTEQFTAVGLSVLTSFTSLIIGVTKASKQEETGNKINWLSILQWIFIIVSIAVATVALHRTI